MDDKEELNNAIIEKFTSHNMALLDALADAVNKNKEQAEHYNNIIIAMLKKNGGSIEIEQEFVEGFDDLEVIVRYKHFDADGLFKIWLENKDEQ